MLFIDLEVFSEASITDVPIDVYATHPSTRIILACAAEDDGPMRTFEDFVSLTVFLRSLPEPRLCAWNVGFERTVLAARGFRTPLSRWEDPMVQARYVGLPGGLKQAAKVELLQVPAEAATKSETLLIKKFCMPSKDGRVHNAQTDPEDWAAFVDYCRRDVETLRHIYNRLNALGFTLPPSERRVWELDQKINARGLPIDVETSIHAASEVVRLTGAAQAKMKGLTGLDNPNSVHQLLPWLKERGYIYDSLGKEFVQSALDSVSPTAEARQVLTLRLDAAKSSVKKFKAIVEGVSPDGRLRQQFKYYGAHTGRWSGRGAQPQNLPRNPTDEKELENLIRRGMIPTLDTLSTCIRPMIKAEAGKKLVVSDLSAIENRVLAWLSGCDSMMEIYARGRDPYKDFATKLPGGPLYEDVTKALRQICKPAVLGCGYGLGPGQERQLHTGQVVFTGLRAYASNMGISLTGNQSREMVSTFRSTYHEVVDYWYYLQEAFYAACKTKKRQQVGVINFTATSDAVMIELPSGRNIHYLNPRAWKGAKGIEIRFDGLRNGQWCSVTTWGGSLTENVVQAVSRDVLVEGMFRSEEKGFTLVGHCHDELIAEVSLTAPENGQMLAASMSEPISWAKGLPLAAEGWEGERYAKG